MQRIKAVYIGIFLLTCLLHGGYAQLPNEGGPGSLSVILNASQQQKKDTTFLAQANTTAYQLANNQPDSALQLLRILLTWCKAARYQRGETEATKLHGNALQTQGKFDSALLFFAEALTLAEKYNLPDQKAGILNNIGLAYTNKGNYPEALRHFFAALASLPAKEAFIKTATINNIGNVYFFQGKMEAAIGQYSQMLTIAKANALTKAVTLAHSNLGETYLMQEKWAPAKAHLDTAFAMALQGIDANVLVAVSKNMAKVYAHNGALAEAEKTFRQTIALAAQKNYAVPAAQARLGLAEILIEQKAYGMALPQADTALQAAQQMGQVQLLRDAHELLYIINEGQQKPAQALLHYKAFRHFSDSLLSVAHEREIANLQAAHNFSIKEAALQQQNTQQRWWLFSVAAGLATFLLIAIMVNKNRKKLSLAYAQLNKNNADLAQQKDRLEKTLDELQKTQAQLIHAEKMASFGQLTAGVAHEIQNPLNFVNNFSEVSKELIDEMKEALAVGSVQSAVEIADDISQNLEKINHHGKRADAIVKSMLAHSRTSSGKKEPTDLNILADEYLRLAFHGMKAKEKSFHANYTLHANPALPRVNIIPQEIGRVLINLISNAFYAVHAKAKDKTAEVKDGSPLSAPMTLNYAPMVTVSSNIYKDKVELIIEDNGKGIPENIREKIFQPFFTTKPTGEGTGLGLSLSYDIVKAHGGTLSVESIEGGGSTFTISLPLP